MEDHRGHLHRGFNWLGGAAILAKITDFGTILLVLRLLTKEQVGAAALVVAFGAVIEAFDGLGANTALIQAASLSRIQLDSLFWFIMGSACVVGGATLLVAPWIASLYGIGGLGVYFLAIAIKQPLVGAAVVPLAMLNRELQYERIAVVNVASTFGAALTRLGLAVAGAGAWSIVIAYTASGLFTLIGAAIASPFLPRFQMRLSIISPLLRVGVRATLSGLCEQMINNVHHLLVGWFYGAAALAEFRVVFDLAMEPANAAGTLINRTALPVLARVAAKREDFVHSLTWSLRRLLAVVVPVALALSLGAGPITTMIQDEQHHSYASASLPLRLLAAAAVMRVVSQLAYPAMFASGRPQLAVQFSVVTLVLLTTTMLSAGFLVPPAYGLVAISAAWLAVPPIVLLWQAHALRRFWHIGILDLIRALRAPLAAAVIVILAVEAVHRVTGTGGPALELATVVVPSVLACIGLLMRDS